MVKKKSVKTKPADSNPTVVKTKSVIKAKPVKSVPNIQFWGDKDIFKLISKIWSEKENWIKATKAMQIDSVGCVVQVTTQQGDKVTEAVTFVPGVIIWDVKNSNGVVFQRRLVAG